MASRLNPYIQFDGDARAAMEFYKGVFGGELSSNTFKEFGASHGPDDDDKLMHSQLETPSGFTLMAADTPQMEMPEASGAAHSRLNLKNFRATK